jgi:uncharacterized protein YceH (UPF0502 family)
MDLTDLNVEEALASLQKKGLVFRITGGRVERWRHNLYETWKADKVELAILAELLLRGPQTEGELRGRASRMEPIEDLDALRALLKPMAERRLVVYLSPQGRRGTMVTHGFLAQDELKKLRERHWTDEPPPTPVAVRREESNPPGASGGARPAAADQMPALEARVVVAEGEITDLRKIVAELQIRVADLTDQLKGLKGALGV